MSRDGSVDWCCFHRFDASPVFARILDWRRGGHFRVAPAGPFAATRRYLPGTNILETRFRTPGGVLAVVDCLPVAPTSDPGVAERVHPYHQLIRVLRCEAGEVEVEIEFNPRFEFGLTYPRLEMSGEDVGIVYGGPDALVLQSRVPIAQTDRCGCGCRATLRAGEEAFVVLTAARPHEVRVARLGPEEVARRVEDTRRFWLDWSARCLYQGPYREEVLRSALVLKALTNAPTGAIVAAPTTSLPEEVGGTRNWDYRYTWLRDAAIELHALFRLGYTDEAHAFMRWLMRTTAGRAEDLQVVYGVGGERLLHEVELPGLDGYRGSRPVRVGNGAATQFQLDVYGELLDAAWAYHRHGGSIEPRSWEFLREVVQVVAERWREPDEGMWEVRGGRRHFVSSKVMAWVAVDRALRLARELGVRGSVGGWRRLRAAIRRRIEAEGVDPETGSLVQAFGTPSADASTLLAILTGFLAPRDPRARATVERVERELTRDGLVYRYRGPDGLPGGEGAFLVCSFWLVDALALIGEVERGRELFEHLRSLANDVGLLSEEVDPESGELLGNFPQAFSHAGLIGAAHRLQRTRARSGRRGSDGRR